MAKENIIQPYSLFGGAGRSVFYHSGNSPILIPSDSLINVLAFKLTSDIDQTLQEPSMNGTEVIIRNDSTSNSRVRILPPNSEVLIEGVTEFTLPAGARVTLLYYLSNKIWVMKSWDNSTIIS